MHIHTPGTKKNDQFKGINGSTNIEEKWTEYIKKINNYHDDVSVLGITDYFSVDNYFKFKEKQKSGEITKNIDLVIPNIELRITPVTSSGKFINIHCLFNPDFAEEIESRFLQKLEVSDRNVLYNASRSGLIDFGKELDKDNNHTLDYDKLIQLAVNNFYTSYEKIEEIYERDEKVRENMLIVVANGKDGVDGIKEHKEFQGHQDFIKSLDRKSALRPLAENIYRFSDGIFSSTPSDIKYFSGNRIDPEVLTIEIGGPMPCFHGCDAHDNKRILEPHAKRYCWVKADPTFNGLRQTLYEPEFRVKIQETFPEVKIPYDTIDKIVFDNCKHIVNKEIVFNTGLNSIIGGRSTGKSTLLSCIARQLNYEEEWDKNNNLENLDYKGKSKNKFLVDFTETSSVWWNNERIDKDRKIEYFPQGYMSEFAREKQKFNNLVEGMLRSKHGKIIYESLSRQQLNNSNNISNNIRLLFDTIDRKLKKQEELKRLGSIESIEQETARLDAIIKEIQEQNATQ